MSATETVDLTKADFQSDQQTRWCPGCGDYAILASVQTLMPDLGIPPERVVFVTGIGCAGRFSYYMDTYGMHAIHGRAPAIATGLAASRDDLSVWIVSGDGDALSIGGNHLIHTLRRNVPVKILLFNNRIYGLTKGQISPTSERGKVTKSTPSGSLESAVNPTLLALAAGGTFVARTLDRDKQHMAQTLRAAADHKGTAFVEILQNCPVFNDNANAHILGDEATENRIDLVAGEPIRFGPEGEHGVVADGFGGLGVEPVADAGEDKVVVHDPTREDPGLALALARLGDPIEGPVPLGVLRSVSAPPWGEGLVAEHREARKSLTRGRLGELLAEGDTWTVG